MADILQFIAKPHVDGEADELILRVEELLQDFPMRSIVLALFHAAKETEDIADIYPSTIQVLKKTLDNPEK